MNWESYDGEGNLIERGDAEDQKVYGPNGEFIRDYTPAEKAQSVAVAAQNAWNEARDNLTQQLATGVAAIQQAKDAAQADIATAEALRVAATNISTEITTQLGQVAAWTPGTTYKQSDLIAIKGQIQALLNRQKVIADAMAQMYVYRKAVDSNAVTTDNALLWLARLVSDTVLD